MAEHRDPTEGQERDHPASRPKSSGLRRNWQVISAGLVVVEMTAAAQHNEGLALTAQALAALGALVVEAHDS